MYFESGVFQVNKWQEELCGDSIQLSRKNGELLLVLSDGLGSGVKANILSTLTSTIIITMLTGGATLAEVVDTVTKTLPVCQVRKFAYSTFTIVRVEANGRTQLVEFDNPSAILIKDGKLEELAFEEEQLAGKLIRKSSFTLAVGDCLILVSDGVVHAGAGGILNLGWQWEHVAAYSEKLCRENEEAQEVATWMGKATEQLYEGKPQDDATIVVLKGRDSRAVTVAVGPPLSAEQDPLLANTLATAPGQKVICGGTTSQIIAREWGKELEVELIDDAAGVPPTGRLQGVDLVTEGVITLAQAKELLGTDAGSLGEDGASRLVEILQKGDEITFLVGRAINPAHQNPNFPLDLGLKSQLVRELAQQLEEMNKTVTVKYF